MSIGTWPVPGKAAQRALLAWGGAGTLLIALMIAVAAISRQFDYGFEMTERPILSMTALLVLAGAFHVAFISGIYRHWSRTANSRALAYWVFGVGVVVRLIMSVSQPILEDDWYRYLWDGAVTASGMNPYAATPRMVQEGEYPALEALVLESGIVLERVNHPELGTVYPPAAQAIFALAHWIQPWRLSGLRVVYFGLDCVVFALLLALLGRLGRSPFYVAIYWWNPLLVKESYNSAHMDLLAVPWVLGALLLLFHRRSHYAAVCLAVATGIKLWPLLLVPPLLASCAREPRRAFTTAMTYGVTTTIIHSLMVPAMDLGVSSGFVAYSRRWEMNDALFMVLPWLIGLCNDITGDNLTAAQIHYAARAVAAGIALAASLYVAHDIARERGEQVQPVRYRQRVAASWCLVAATLFLVSPTQFPWYYGWFLPLLALVPRWSLLLLTAMLPLYYLRFYFEAHGRVDLFHNGIVWIEYAPVWVLLIREWAGARRGEYNRLLVENLHDR